MSMPACFTHHPDEESVMAVAMDNGKERRYCKICMRVRAKRSYFRAVEKRPSLEAYGVLPRLVWEPPEFLLGLSHESPVQQCPEALK